MAPCHIIESIVMSGIIAAGGLGTCNPTANEMCVVNEMSKIAVDLTKINPMAPDKSICRSVLHNIRPLNILGTKKFITVTVKHQISVNSVLGIRPEPYVSQIL